MNICKTCTPDGNCVAVDRFPNATVAEYGTYHYDAFAMMAEIYTRGPITASVNAEPLVNYTGGVIWDAPEYRSDHHNHGVSIVGWGYDADHDYGDDDDSNSSSGQYWIVRNSWGQYWGEMG